MLFPGRLQFSSTVRFLFSYFVFCENLVKSRVVLVGKISGQWLKKLAKRFSTVNSLYVQWYTCLSKKKSLCSSTRIAFYVHSWCRVFLALIVFLSYWIYPLVLRLLSFSFIDPRLTRIRLRPYLQSWHSSLSYDTLRRIVAVGADCVSKRFEYVDDYS